MTDHDDTSGPDPLEPSGHLDDEGLSAVLDGEATAADNAHADGCETCSARLGELRDASLLVRTPVPLADDATREAAVAAALAAAAEANVVPLRRRPPPAWLAAAAAVVAIAIGAVALANRDDSSRQSTAASKGAEDSAALETTTALAPFAAAIAPVDGGDLGEVEGTDLRATIDGALATRVERSTADETAGGSASAAGSAQAAAPTCEINVRDGNQALGPLVFRASGTYGGDAVEVLAFDVSAPDGKVDRWVYVVTVGACAIKNQTTYSAQAAP